jgi:serine/threonine protein kinase
MDIVPMSLSSRELWRRIADEGLASASQCRNWAAEVAKSIPPQEIAHGINILQRMLALGLVTKYQARVLAGQSSSPLHRGQWILRDLLSDPIWRDWYEITSIESATGEGPTPTYWAIWIDGERLRRIRSCGPSHSRCNQLATLQHANLQQTYGMEETGEGVLLRVAPLPGESLTSLSRATLAAPKVANQIAQDIAAALRALHEIGIVHGRVFPDRVFYDGTSARLAIDPLCVATAMPDELEAGCLGSDLRVLQTAHFLAPEFVAPAQRATFATDIYAFGSLWYWLLTGEPLAPGNSTNEILASQAASSRSLESVRGVSPPLRVCLQHCLGRNLPARFSSAIELDTALRLANPPTSHESLAAHSSIELRAPVSDADNDGQDARQNRMGDALGASTVATLRADRSTAASLSSVSSSPRRVRRRIPRWLIPAGAVGGGLVALLLLAVLAGMFNTKLPQRDISSPTSKAADLTHSPTINAPADPRLDAFNMVAQDIRFPWAPPSVSSPIPIDMLPHGTQLYLFLRSNDSLTSTTTTDQLLNLFQSELGEFVDTLANRIGPTWGELQGITLGFGTVPDGSAAPPLSVRCQLRKPISLGALRQLWGSQKGEASSVAGLFLGADDWAYYVRGQLDDDQRLINEFAFGPVALMQEVAASDGSAGPMLPQLEKLWQQSSEESDLCLLLATPYLFTEGRSLLHQLPPNLQSRLQKMLEFDARAAMLQTTFETQWYLELQFVGTSDRDASKINALLSQQLNDASYDVEQWLVSETPHPYWRAVALRFPNMLRVLGENARFGVENGRAIANAYLPSRAAPNLLFAAWMAAQSNATERPAVAKSDSQLSGTDATKAGALTADEILARPITLSFDQEPIEVALQLIADEANAGLAADQQKLTFLLDGDAFEKAGITRNQQLRNFTMENRPVREALTEVAKRGNPVTTVKDIRDSNQILIWVVADQPDQPDQPDQAVKQVVLTTRSAAQAANFSLPAEFAPP